MIVSSLFVACFPAFAGHYDEVEDVPGGIRNPSGGTWTISPAPENGPSSGPFYALPDGHYGASAHAATTMTVRTATATATGTITKKYHWVSDGPGDLPPKNVIVTESCSVSGTASSNPDARGSYPASKPAYPTVSNGLGTPAVTSDSDYNGSFSSSRTSNGTHTRVIPGADPLVIECTVNASAEADAPEYGSAGAEVSVSYKVLSISPVVITIGGATPTLGGLKVLTGQGLTATLSGCTLVSGTKPTWSFASGGDKCFGKFYIQGGATYNSASQVPPELGELGVSVSSFPATFASGSIGGEIAVDKDVLMLKFFTKDEGTVKVSATATALLPDGTTATVSAESRAVQSNKPSSLWQNVSPMEHLTGHDEEDKFMYANVTWKPTITVYAPFTGGEGSFAQLLTPNRTNTRVRSGTNSQAATTYVLIRPLPSGGSLAVNGMKGHDGTFPYGLILKLNPLGEYAPVLGATTWAVGEDILSGDKPRHSYTPPDVDNGGMDWRSASAADSFETWLMYKPNEVSNGVSWVPLKKRSWSWSGNASRDATGSWTQTVGCVVQSDSDAGGTFPKWASIAGGTMGPAP